MHLQGVPTAKRFALVPLGPPLLSYSSTSKAMLTYNQDKKAVQFTADRDYKPGEPLTAWCGPQPNSRLLINYGEWEKGGVKGGRRRCNSQRTAITSQGSR